MDEESAPAAPVCAAHEGAPATGTCERCGNFVCPLCLDPDVLQDLRCADCRARGGGHALPWEGAEGSWLTRWWQTCRAVVFQPTLTFAWARPGSTNRALGFVAVTGAFIGLVLGLLGACALGALFALGAPADLGAIGEESFTLALLVFVIVAYPVLVPIGFLISVVFRSLVYHAGVAALGGHGGINASFWVVSYLHAIHLTMLPLVVVQQIPIVGPLVALMAYVGVEIFYALQLTNAARSLHGLEGGRAAFAGWLGFLVVAVLLMSCCGLGMLLALAPNALR